MPHRNLDFSSLKSTEEQRNTKAEAPAGGDGRESNFSFEFLAQEQGKTERFQNCVGKEQDGRTVNTGLKRPWGKARQAAGEPVSLGVPSHPGPGVFTHGARGEPTPLQLTPFPAPLPIRSLTVSGSAEVWQVIVLSCRLSAMVLSKRLLPRPESLPNTAARSVTGRWAGDGTSST